jgi:hypothetical protein
MEWEFFFVKMYGNIENKGFFCNFYQTKNYDDDDDDSILSTGRMNLASLFRCCYNAVKPCYLLSLLTRCSSLDKTLIWLSFILSFISLSFMLLLLSTSIPFSSILTNWNMQKKKLTTTIRCESWVHKRWKIAILILLQKEFSIFFFFALSLLEKKFFVQWKFEWNQLVRS